MRLLDYSVGFCIQEVAALSTLLGEEFDRRKVEMMETVLAEGGDVRAFSRYRDWFKQQLHASRIMRFARFLMSQKHVHPTLPRSLRLKMLEELLHLQELAISLIDAVVSRVLRSNPEGELSLELTNEVTEEVRRIVYLRRAQVFMSPHLSHQLRAIENMNHRGILLQQEKIAKIEARPKLTFDEQVTELIHVGKWRKKTVDETRKAIEEANAKKEESVYYFPPRSQSAASERQGLRLKMLEELLHLQELAISLIDAVVSRVLRSNPEGELSLELTNEVTEEVRRIVYLRRAQVFMSPHLSHQLRAIENMNHRGILLQQEKIAKIEARPKLTFDEQVTELIHVGKWRKKTVDETRKAIEEANAKKEESVYYFPPRSQSAASERQATTPLLRSSPPTLQSHGTSQNWRGSPKSGLSGEVEGYLPRHHESQVTQSAATDVVNGSGTHFASRRPACQSPLPEFHSLRVQSESSFMGVTSMKEISTGGFGNTEASLAPETLPATGRFSQMYIGGSELKSYVQPYQAPTLAYHPGQSLPELGTAPSEPGVSLNIRWDEHASLGPASTSSLDARLQRTVAGADVPLEAPRQDWDAAKQSGVATTPSWSPWSRNWPPLLPSTPPRQTPASTSPTAAWSPWSSNWPTLLPITPQRQTPHSHMTLDRSQGGTSHQTSQKGDRLPWVSSFFPAPSPSSGPFTTQQSMASAGATMLYSGQPQEGFASEQSMTPPPSRPHLPKQPSSISPASSLMMEQGV
ncbi:hypothetical protein EMWEY_00059580, partial [Eimeria maxima]